MGFFSIFEIFKKINFKTIGAGLLVIILGGFVFYQVHTIHTLKNKNNELKNEIIIKNTKINNLKVQEKKLKDTIQAKKFENNQKIKKIKLQDKIKDISQSKSVIIKNDKNQTINSINTVKRIKDLKPGNYTIEIK